MTERTWRSPVELHLTGGQAAVEQALAALQTCFGPALVVTSGPGAQIGGPEWEVEAHLTITLPEGAEEAVSFWQELPPHKHLPRLPRRMPPLRKLLRAHRSLGVAPCSAQTSE